jgi:hypothetical protein
VLSGELGRARGLARKDYFLPFLAVFFFVDFLAVFFLAAM